MGPITRLVFGNEGAHGSREAMAIGKIFTFMK